MENGSTSQRPRRRAQTLGRWCCIALSGAILLAAGCNRSFTSSDDEPERSPNYLRAKKLYESRDYKGAAECFNQSLLDHPRFAKAHLELGLLYDDKLGDPIAAIYHYRRYLELSPRSDKRQLVEDFIERAKLSLAAKLPQSPVGDPEELARLQTENAALRAHVSELERPAGPATGVAAVPAAGTGGAPGTGVTTTPAARVHVIQKGDTLQALGLRYYGSRSAWEKIYAANRTVLASKDQLRIGQELVIP
jgi:tetratricopeptide (TPR) repeat protein